MKLKKFLPYAPLAIILTIAAYFFFSKLGRNIFWDWDECLYGQYVQEMPQAGHYLTNIWNGYIDMQKPPLYTWLLFIPKTLFGQTEFALRSLSAFAGLSILTAVYLFCKKHMTVLTATFATLILLAAELFVIYSLRLNTDMLYTLFIFLGVWSWLSSTEKRRYVYLAGLMIGLATMVKGIGTIQILAAIFVTIFIRPSKKRFLDYLLMGATVALVSVPWHGIAYLTYGYDFFRVYVLDNIIKRGKYPIEFHRERWWFYFVLMFNELKPWLFAGVVFPITFAVEFFTKKSPKKIVKRFIALVRKYELLVTLLILILIPLASLVRFQTRLAWYVLYLYPFIAIFLAYNIEMIIAFIVKKMPAKHRKNASYALIGIVIVCLSQDAARLLIREVKPLETERTYSNRELAINEIQKYQQPSFDYLVPFGERQAREILPETEQIDMTWVYGGHPCAVYYSEKDVTYHYNIEEFKQTVGVENQLYMLHKDDIAVTDEVTTELEKEILYENDEFVIVTFRSPSLTQ